MSVFLMLTLSVIRMKSCPVLRQISMWIYIFHPVIIRLCKSIVKSLDATGTLNDNAQ